MAVLYAVRAADAQPTPSASSPLRCLAAALVPHRRGTHARKRPFSKLRRPGHPQSWVCPGSFTQSATSIKVSCPSRSESCSVPARPHRTHKNQARPDFLSLLSLTSPVPPSIHITTSHSPFLPSSILPQPALHASGPRIPFARACTVRVLCVCMCVFVCVCQNCTSYDRTRRVRLDVSSSAHQLPVCQPICTELKESWRCSEPGARDTGYGSTLPTPALHPSQAAAATPAAAPPPPGEQPAFCCTLGRYPPPECPTEPSRSRSPACLRHT